MRMEGEGYTGDYTWGQTDQDILIVIPVGEELRGKKVKYDLHTTVFELEELFRPVVADDSFWEIDEENGSKILRIQLSKAAQGVEWTHLLTRDDTPPDVTVTDLCFFDVGVDGESIGQVTFGLYGNAAPKTAANFMALCTGEVTTPDGKPLHYLDSPFHRIIPGFMCQGGDFTTGDGTGGMSIFGEWFADEAFLVKHDRALLLSMANFEVKDSNGSQFLITCGPAPHLDGRHVVFGEVLDGGGVVKQMEMLGTASGATLKDVRILACGAL
ncbi:cyclophilin-like domain-containing protein [Baffinella frigidus]|nr:cyclophilin-like domain-containing protein [Cryptophyta sp. CCMP2293]